MARRLKLVTLQIICGFVAILLAGQTVPAPFSVVLSAHQSTFKRGSEVTLDVAVTNNTDQKIHIAPRTGTSGLEVRDSDGRAVKKIEEVDSAKKPETGSPSNSVRATEGSYLAIEIGPRQTIHFQEIVTNKFDLCRPGTYTIRATHEYSNSLVKSNFVTIVTTP